MMKIKILFLMALFFLSACVHEVTGKPFQDPTTESLQRALGLYVQIAYKQMEEKKYDVAVQSLNKARAIDQKSPVVETAFAVLYQLQGEGDKAEEIFKKTIHGDPKSTDTYLRYGNFLYDQERYSEACANFKKASEDDFYSQRAMVFYNLGVCYRNTKEFDLAENAFARCLGLQPDNTNVLLELADLRFEKKSYSDSKRYFDQYVKADRDRGGVLSAHTLLLGIKLERVFENKDAEGSFALKLKNNYPYSEEYLEYKNGLKK